MRYAKVAAQSDIKEAPVPPAGCHPKIREAFAYWQRIHPERGLPGRQHLEPTDIPALLSHVRLLDVEGRPPRFKVRVSGTQYAERLGTDTTGCYLDELLEAFDGSRFHRALVGVVEQKRPIWRSGPLQWVAPEPYSNVERIHLPLARDGATVDMVLSVTVFQN